MWKGIALLLVGMLVTPSATMAQRQRRLEGALEAQSHTQRQRGWFVQGQTGLTVGFLGNLTTDLNREGSLQTPALEPAEAEDYRAQGLGNEFGLTGGYLFRGKWLVQGGVQYREYTAARTFRGETWLRNLSYTFQVGYAVRNRDRLLLYPFLGYAYGEHRLRIDNYHTEPITFGDLAIEQASAANLTATAGTVELGFSALYQLGNLGSGALLGAQAGAYVSAGGGDWEADGTAISGTNPAGYSGVYLRVSLGWGRFTTERAAPRRSIYDEVPDVEDVFQAPAQGQPAKPDVKRAPTRSARDLERSRGGRSTRNKSGKSARERSPKSSELDDVDGR